jgi:zinc protease
MKRLLLLVLFIAFPIFADAALAVKEVKSSKGITAWLQEDQSMPIVALAFAWRGGFELDPEDRQGLSMVAADMLTHGAGKWDDNAFTQALQENSISLDFDARRDAISGNLRCLKENLPQAVEMLSASVNAPLIAKDTLERQKAHAATRLKFQLADPDWLLLRMAMRETFAGHPYGKRALGTVDSIKAITVDDVKAWRKHFARGNLLVTATGAINEAELSKLLDDVFGALPEKTDLPVTPEAPFSVGGKSYHLILPGPQAQLFMEWQGFKRKDADWYAGEVMDYILGGGSFSSRLMKEIREKRGLTYGVSSNQSSLERAGLFTAQASFMAKNSNEVLKLVNDEVKKISDTPVSADELEAAKDYLIGAYPLQLTSTSAIAGHLLNLRLNNLPVNEEEKRATAIKAVTLGDVKRVAKKIFEKPGAVFWVGPPGDGKKVDDVLQKPNGTFMNVTPSGIKADQVFDKVD